MKTMQQCDLAIAYRIYPKVAKVAASLPAGDDKLQLSEICLRSFEESLRGLRVKLWVLLDGCDERFADLFRKYFRPEQLVLIQLNSVGNHATFAEQIDLLLQQQDSDMVYFAEDDYLYLPGQFSAMLRFLSSQPGVDFVSPYDHPDCYNLEAHRDPKWIRVQEGRHWRTAASTCLTFLTRKQTLRRYERTFRTYSKGNFDFSLWLSLTKKSLFNPLRVVRLLSESRWMAAVVVKAWLYCWRQLLFGATANLWVPIPAIATHLNADQLSSGVDWIALMRAGQAEIEAEKPELVSKSEFERLP